MEAPVPPINGLSAAEAAEVLGTSPAYVNKLVSKGRLPRPRYVRQEIPLEAVETLALERWSAPGHP